MTQTRVLVTGARGMLGSIVLARFRDSGCDVRGTTHQSGVSGFVSWDIASASAPAELRAWRPSLIIHAAALTDVDRCETHPDEAEATNVDGSRRVAQLAAESQSRLVYISTDSVFDGVRGTYRDDETPRPINTYARTKLEGERAASSVSPGTLVLRVNFVSSTRLTAWILDNASRSIEIPVFTDVIFNPLDVRDLSAAIEKLVEAGITGVQHLGTEEPMSKAEYASRLVAAAGLESMAKLRMSSLLDVQLKAARPADTSLVPSPAARKLLGPLTLERAFRDFAAPYARQHRTIAP